MVIFGGVVLIGIIILICVFIVGWVMIGLGLGLIKGDFELVEVGVVIVVCVFFFWC